MNYLNIVQAEVESFGFSIINKDLSRPWGGFLVIDERQSRDFVIKYFNDIDIKVLEGKKVSPKILIVRPHSRLSWQYHHRRVEYWQVFRGSVGVIRSMNDIEGKLEVLNEGSQIVLAQGERHRLIGLSGYGVVAEIWQHTSDVVSDEFDIVRLQDDFGRC